MRPHWLDGRRAPKKLESLRRRTPGCTPTPPRDGEHADADVERTADLRLVEAVERLEVVVLLDRERAAPVTSSWSLESSMG